MIIPEQVNIKKYYVLHFHIPYLANRITLLKNVYCDSDSTSFPSQNKECTRFSYVSFSLQHVLDISHSSFDFLLSHSS